MKNKVMKMAAALAIALVAECATASSYLYWRTGDTITSLFDGTSIAYDYAKVWYGAYDQTANAKGGGSYLNAYAGAPYASMTDMGDSLYATDGAIAPAYWGNGSEFNSGNFFVYELYNEGDVLMGFLARQVSWDAYALAGGVANGAASPYVLNGIIPEPSSGLLSLIGLGILALRRKRA